VATLNDPIIVTSIAVASVVTVSPSSESPNILCRSYSYRVASAPRGLDGHACAASRLSFIGLRLY
jgi:hypothetical protein